MIAEEKPAARPTHLSTRFWRYGPLIIWAALIFIGSSDLLSASHTSGFLRKPLHWFFPGVSEAAEMEIQVAVRKLGHFAEYAILALLAARALRSSAHDLLRRRWFLLSLLFVILYALSDEFHQSFVSSRSASIFDSMIDTAGGLAALIVVAIRQRRIRQDLQD